MVVVGGGGVYRDRNVSGTNMSELKLFQMLKLNYTLVLVKQLTPCDSHSWGTRRWVIDKFSTLYGTRVFTRSRHWII